MNIWYFAEPTIGYCPDCDVEAIYKEGHGLECPKCSNPKDNLSIFLWDGISRDPESFEED